MRDFLPLILIGLAVFAAGCVAVFAWELTKEALRDGEHPDDAD